MRFVLFVVVLFNLAGCATFQKISDKKDLTLIDTKSFRIGSTTPDDLLKAYGAPWEKIKSEDGESWLYLTGSGSGQRAAFGFSREGTLSSVLWLVMDSEPEQKLVKAMQLFEGAHFARREAEWINPHSAPDEVYFEDHTLGISIELRKLRNEVSSISWFDPKDRKLADAKPKQYQKYIHPETGLVGVVDATDLPR